MDNYEDYIIRVLHRTSSGLLDSLTPAHGVKLKKLVEQFEQTPSVVAEIQALMGVHGFAKVALALEWLTERIIRPEEVFTPEQFESDVLLLNEKIFEAFLNQPFDMPEFGPGTQGTAESRTVQQNVQVSADEFVGTTYQHQNLSHTEIHDPGDDDDIVAETEENAANIEPKADPFASLDMSLRDTSVDVNTEEYSPSLEEVMDADLFKVTDRITTNAIQMSEKTMNERVVAAAVLRVNAKTGLDLSKKSGNVIVQEFFSALLKFINTADESGKIKSEAFADVIRDIGDRLSNAQRETGNGISVLKTITEFIHEPKELLGKK